MKIRYFSLLLSVLMLFSICACKSQSDTGSNEVEIVETETIVVGDDGNEITSSNEELVSSNDNISQNESMFTSTGDNTFSENESSEQTIKIDYDTVVEVDICGDIVRGYLVAKDARSQFFWLDTYKSTRADFQHITLNWVLDKAPYTIYMSENSDFSNAKTIVTDSFNVKCTIFVPGKTYYWKVIGSTSDKVLGGGKLKINDAPVRWIGVDGIYNVRDMGGWKTESGKTVKYEMLYRGSQLNAKNNGGMVVNSVSEDGLDTLKQLGIKTEFDLRADTDVRVPPEGINLNYVSVTNHTAYHNIFEPHNKDLVVANYKEIFKHLSDESNYPIYTHCQGGADRTGTYAFLLNGLLGVSYEDLTRDFELTSFAGIKRWRGEGRGNTFSKDDTSYKTETGQLIAWGELYNGMMDYGKQNNCTTLQQSIEHWFVNYIGIPQLQIDSFKSIMLE